MKLCLCKNVCEEETKQFLTMEDFIQSTKATTMCGICKESILKIFENKKNDKNN